MPCVGAARIVGSDVIDDFEARGADAADAILVEEALRAAGPEFAHPSAADLAMHIELHVGRVMHRFADGAGVRRDSFHLRTASAAEAFADAIAGAIGDEARVIAREGRVVVMTTAAGDINAAAFAFNAPVDRYAPLPIDASGTVLSLGGDRPALDPAIAASGIEQARCRHIVPCDLRAADCRECLIGWVEGTLGDFGARPQIIELSPDEAEAVYTGPLWAGDRLFGRLDAAARFALGVDRVRRDSTDEAAISRARRVAAWYEGVRRGADHQAAHRGACGAEWRGVAVGERRDRGAVRGGARRGDARAGVAAGAVSGSLRASGRRRRVGVGEQGDAKGVVIADVL